ncbi:MAG TPA: LiaF domain-containing protein [Bacteroidales bacterium]|nr:LiaF domain-containing protein [Bacteroidales bacterium]
MKNLRFALLLFLVPGMLLASKPREIVFRKSLPLREAKEVKSDISFFAGELYMDVNSKKLVECYYGYMDLYIVPYMIYKEVDRIGYLTIKSKREKREQLDNRSDDNKWKLELNRNVKNDLDIELMAGVANINLEGADISNFAFKMTAGESKINLRNTSVPKIRLNMMAGETTLNLSGKWQNDCDAEIKGGVGQINVKVPFKTGVRIHARGLLGEVNIPFFHKDGRDYTNDAWGKSKHNINIEISGAIGEINVEMVE